MADYRVISSDNHVVEPPDTWTSRVEPKYRDRCPRVESTEKGDTWFVDNAPTFATIFGMASQPGRRFEDPDSLVQADSFENARPGSYDGHEALKDMDIDGVDVGLVYPSLAIFLYIAVADSELLTVIHHTYNDFAAEYCSADLKRLKPIATLNVDDIRTGVKEMERCAKMGFIGATIPAYNVRLPYSSPDFDLLWAAAQDLDMPLSLHIATPRPEAGVVWDHLATDSFAFSNHLLANGDHWVRLSFYDMIQTGVFDRFPKLMVGSVEHELNWVPYFLERMDYDYNERAAGRQGYRIMNEKLPSDVFHSNCFVDFQEDALGIKHRDIIGVDNILWGSDYPHTESTWPRSRQFIESTLAGCTEEEKVKIVAGNAARIYRI